MFTPTIVNIAIKMKRFIDANVSQCVSFQIKVIAVATMPVKVNAIPQYVAARTNDFVYVVIVCMAAS